MLKAFAEGGIIKQPEGEGAKIKEIYTSGKPEDLLKFYMKDKENLKDKTRMGTACVDMRAY